MSYRQVYIWVETTENYGYGGKQEPKATLETDQKRGADTDSIKTERENVENNQATEKAAAQWDKTDMENYQKRRDYMIYHNW